MKSGAESFWEKLQKALRSELKLGLPQHPQPPLPSEILGYDPTPEQLSWVDWAFDRKSRRKLFLGARGYGKTDMLLVYGIPLALWKNPAQSFLVMTRSLSRSRSIVGIIGESLRKLGFRGSFSQDSIVLSGIRSDNPKQPQVSALSLHGRTKGHHAKILFLDDPLDPLDIYSDRIQNRVRKVYDEAFNIAENIVVIGQYIGIGDLYTQIEGEVDTLRAWHGTLPFLDISREEFLKTGSPVEWGCNYEGVLYASAQSPLASIQTLNVVPSGTVFAFLDPALGGQDSNALSIGWRFQEYTVIVGFLFSGSYTRALPLILKKLEQYGVSRAYYENNGVGDALYLASGGIFREERSFEPKASRIARLEAPILSGELVLHPQCDPHYVKEVRHYHPSMGAHDDAPDSLAGLWKILHPRTYKPFRLHSGH